MAEAPDRKQDLIEAGRQLFLAGGYSATSVDAICQEAGVTKGAFFHHFKSKDDFAREILTDTWQPVLVAHEDGAGDPDPREELGRHIRFMVGWICDAGRLMPMLAQELGSSNPEIGAQVRGYFETWMGYLMARLKAAADSKGKADTADLESVKDFIVATTEGVPAVRGQFGDQAIENVSSNLVTAAFALLRS